jgi:hypothetical protein
MLGISLDEWRRMRTDSGISYTRLAYPLIDRRMSRMDCINVIQGAGLPVPPKSSCWFCPYHSLSGWRKLRREEPVLFQRVCDLEALLTARAKTLTRHKAQYRPEDQAVYMSSRLRPLARVVGEAVQPGLFADDACESGYCMT